MTNHQEEQQQELEALESIYPDELKILQTSPYAVFEISLKSQKEDYETDEEQASCTVKFGYTATYPDETPVIEITDSENIDEDQQDELMTLMQTTAEENLGMAMVFTMVSAIQEELHCLVDQSKQKKKEEAERKQREEEELEHKKFEGTRVTIENFVAWKAKFDAEMAELNKKKLENDPIKSKLTGKEMFLKDASLMESDVQFLQAEGDNVEVDESLFQDMDDLDIGEEDIDIEDE